ncbi:MAG TPA: hypothetical protein VNN22_03340 [Verrucomicrobiae bacterium]|nr:hypothetical protein [Verrucomicrobiae bacterium]
MTQRKCPCYRPDFHDYSGNPYETANTATTIAFCVVLAELGIISWIRHRFMDMPWASALFQIGLGGALVFLAGILIGNS